MGIQTLQGPLHNFCDENAENVRLRDVGLDAYRPPLLQRSQYCLDWRYLCTVCLRKCHISFINHAESSSKDSDFGIFADGYGWADLHSVQKLLHISVCEHRGSHFCGWKLNWSLQGN